MAFKTQVPREKLEKIAREEGCTVDTKASYVKVTKNGHKTNCLFVAKTKDVSRVDIGGFQVADPTKIRSLGGESHGCVTQQIRSDITVGEYESTFRMICRGLDTFQSLPKKEKVRPPSFGRGAKRKPVETVVVVKADETPKETVDRLVTKLALLRKVAREMGVPVSPKTEKELTEQLEKARKQSATVI